MRGTDGAQGVDGGAGGPVIVSTDATAIQGISVTPLPPPGVEYVLGFDGLSLIWQPGSSGAEYTQTRWVDPNGDPASNGRAPAKPTTLSQALAAAPAGSVIILAAGTYATPQTMATDHVTLQGAVADSSSASTVPAVRLTGLLTITGVSCRIVGVSIEGGVADNSSAAGTTRVSDSSISSAITIAAPAASQVFELSRCDYASISVTGASGGLAILVRDTKIGGPITHNGTGPITINAHASLLTGITNASTGSTSVAASWSTLGGGIVRSAGSIAGVTLVSCVVGSVSAPGTIDATGAVANTVIVIDTVLDRAGSIIPAGAEVVTGLTENSSPVRAESFLPRNLAIGSNLVPAPNNSPTPADHLNFPFTVTSAGLYRFDFYQRLNTSALGTQLAIDFVLDGVSSGLGALTQTNVAGGVYSFSGPYITFLAPGPHTVLMRFWQPTSPGTLVAEISFVLIQRIA